MANILVSLVSDQTIPNVLFIKERHDIDKYLFVSTEEMERKGKYDCIIRAAGLQGHNARQRLIVVGDSLYDVRSKLAALDYDDDDRFYVNLTGGTKIMSIGVYNFFRDISSEIFYIPGGKNLSKKIFPVVKHRQQALKYRLSVAEYLTCYGIDILNPTTVNSLIRTPDETAAWYRFFLGLSEDQLRTLDRLRRFRSKKKTAYEDAPGLASLLNNAPFRSEDPAYLSKHEIRYLSGDWFEEYIYAALKETLNLHDAAIAVGVNIKRDDVQNEFDIMFTHDNHFYVIECKTSVYDAAQKRNIFTDTLYKLSALRKDFGLFARAFIVTLTEQGAEKQHIKPAHVDRSRVHRIDIIDGAKLKTEKWTAGICGG